MASASQIFPVWKPKGPTSHDVIQKIRKLTGVQKVGHAGTLDPLASGVLVVGVGREATKKLKDAVAAEKEYVATVRLGMTSTTDDEEGEKKKIPAAARPSRDEVQEAIKKFIGRISQVPPAFSAIKVKGKAAYTLARQGKEVRLAPRLVEIKSIKILAYRWPYLTIRVRTGPGVYIRALARDIGKKLNTGGYLAELERTRVGQFTKKDAIPFARLKMI